MPVVIGNVVFTPGGGRPSGKHITLRVKNTPRLTRRVVVGPECDAMTPGSVKMPRRCVGSRLTGALPAGLGIPYSVATALETNDCVDCVMSLSLGAAPASW